MKKFIDQDYIVSQSLDYGSNKSVTLKQNSIDLMTQHMIEEVYTVDNTKSLDLEMTSEKPSAMST
jgi:hypothetical protein